MSAPDLTAPDFGSRFLVAEVRGRVLHLRIDRVERRNTFTQDMYRGIKRAAVWADAQAELDAAKANAAGEAADSLDQLAQQLTTLGDKLESAANS